ncbi:glycoside hydrolase family 10 protein [Plantactinospora sp. GCM10030261]|uniref:glycoside hydrolase family 10 protein n=1 Tax=Plantactinospora sp. GCM10030261 TaxID=3273420 RepID=UPI003606C98B
MNRRLLFGLVIALIVVVTVPTGVALLRLGAPEDGPRPGSGGGGAAAGSPTCAGRPIAAPRQLRGMWLTTVNNIDWPSRPGLPVDQVKAEYLGWLDLAQRQRHNAVFVHVRPSGDALWPSEYAPWSEWLTGRRDGRDPGWDPLAWMVAETHARNLEFHAWFNPYRASQPATVGGAGADIAKLAPDHPLRTHRDWAVTHPPKAKSARLYYDPGIPEARRFVEDSILDAVRRYDVDGVHFDDFFYPYPAGADFPDATSYARHGNGIDRAQWRRNNVDTFVREMSERIRATKPWVRFGISPFGIWRNSTTDPSGSATSGLQSYDAIYADTRKWVRERWVDYIVPQLYWHIGFAKADYATLLPWWAKTVEGTGVHLYIGQADYRVGERGAWSDPAELDRQLALNSRFNVDGSVHYSAKQVRADRLGAVARYRDAHYATPALVPTASRLRAAPPGAPSDTTAARAGDQVRLEWRAPAGRAPTGYAVYRVDEAAGDPSGDRPGRGPAGELLPGGSPAGDPVLVATVRATTDPVQRWTDPTAAGRRYTFCVTALDRDGNESGAGEPSSVG